ncbi:probable leucine-rich repeat receptor-like protein kinase At2g28990 [Neltuma alba]|uniref:probable leucine-rich repeat receptor-like protein kinase At2g28990 n=1 Tax=Neltuma alba TaxID=207710 RepID=UPI0010A4E788|nr:probable leucine-rich repeat receptor-like protein kinase At2g28990 [Prosopis alba]
MERAPKLNLCLGLCLVLIQLLLHVGNTMGDGRKLTTNNDTNPGFISIDCGATHDYVDKDTGIWYQTDTKFVETGTNSTVLPTVNLDYPYFGGLLSTLRSFPEGKRNCYSLKPKQGKNHTYLIRAYFAYGNYDGKNQTPIFDLYLGVNHWDTVYVGNNNDGYHITEIIHTPTTDTVHVCLVKTVVGVPFISALELRPLSDAIYQTSSPSQSILINQGRFDVASTSSATRSRYKDDIYDRLWLKLDSQNWIKGDIDIDPARTNDSYKLPAQPVILEYLKPQTVVPQNAILGNVRFNISAASESDAPPILNAFEIYQLISPISSPTDERDVNAIMEIKDTYKISNLDWQGDPCVPKLAWDRLSCRSGINGKNARIVSV